MTRWTLSCILGALLLFSAPCRAQEDLRLYHEAWYLETVAHQPEKALETYRKICRQFPNSPFRRNSLIRQADLLRKLHRPEEARKVLAQLSREGLAREAGRDLKRLEKSAGTLKRREALLRRLKGLRKQLQDLQARLNMVKRRGAPPQEVRALEKRVQELENSIKKIRPRLSETRLVPLWVKRRGLLSRKGFQEARNLTKKILELHKKIRLLRGKEKSREAAKTQAELRKTQARLLQILRPFTGRRRSPRGPGGRGIRFLIEPWKGPMKIRLLLSPRDLAGLNGTTLEKNLRTVDHFIEFVSTRLQREGRKETALQVKRAWKEARRLYEKRSFTKATAQMKALLEKLPRKPRNWRTRPLRRRRLPQPRTPGKTPAWKKK